MDGLFNVLSSSGSNCCIDRYYAGCFAYADDLFLMSPSRKGLQIILNLASKGMLQKKKVTNLGHCPNRGGGGPTPQIECPDLLKCFDTKIELNW